MDEAEWLECTDPHALLQFLKGKASDRKLRLFACACCRLVWDHLTAQRIRRAVETAEQYADGLVAEPDLQHAYSLACDAAHHRVQRFGCKMGNRGREAIGEGRLFFAAEAAHSHTPFLIGRLRWLRWDAELRAQAPAHLRCIFGPLPFHGLSIDPHWLCWGDGIVVRLAQAAYDQRILPQGAIDSSRLAVLADALEEAGCDDADILSHLRGPGQHPRGCWVVDGLLARG
jgi:hypothetical protein